MPDSPSAVVLRRQNGQKLHEIGQIVEVLLVPESKKFPPQWLPTWEAEDVS